MSGDATVSRSGSESASGPMSGLASLFAVLLAFFAAIAARETSRASAPGPTAPPLAPLTTLTSAIRGGLGERADALDLYRSHGTIAIRFDRSLDFAPGAAAPSLELASILSGIGGAIAGRVEAITVGSTGGDVELSSRRALAAATALIDAGIVAARLSIVAGPGPASADELRLEIDDGGAPEGPIP